MVLNILDLLINHKEIYGCAGVGGLDIPCELIDWVLKVCICFISFFWVYMSMIVVVSEGAAIMECRWDCDWWDVFTAEWDC